MKSTAFLNQLNEYQLLAAEVYAGINTVVSWSAQKLFHCTTYIWPLKK
jgi:hypothetical protein